jgi:hypothetical protein
MTTRMPTTMPPAKRKRGFFEAAGTEGTARLGVRGVAAGRA